MRAVYKEGFILFKSGKRGPVFVAPHASMSLLSISRGDIWSELITARLVRSLGGFGVVSTVPRKGKYGIDYFRIPASMKEAVDMFKAHERNDYDAQFMFEKKYAFFARDEEEYLEKANIYNQFWTTIETLAPKNPLFILVHTQGTRLKNFPSLIDIATLSGKWMDERKAKKAAAEANERNASVFASLKPELKKYALAWAEIWLKRGIAYRFEKFDISKMRGSFRAAIIDDLKRASELLGSAVNNSIGFEEYLSLVERAVEAGDFTVTYQNAFNGKPGEERIGRLLDRCGGEALLLEISSFLNEMYPDISVKLISNMLSCLEREKQWSRFEKFISKA